MATECNPKTQALCGYVFEDLALELLEKTADLSIENCILGISYNQQARAKERKASVGDIRRILDIHGQSRFQHRRGK